MLLPLVLLIISIVGLVLQGVTWYWITALIISLVWILLRLGGGGGTGGDFFDTIGDIFGD